MSSVLLLIMALNSVNFHSTKNNCSLIASVLVNVAARDAMNPKETRIHWDEDLNEIIKFKKECVKKVK